MTGNEAIAQLKALTQGAQAARDAAAANAILAQASTIARDASLAQNRELAAALINCAAALVAFGAPVEVEALFGDAQRVLNASKDPRIDDQLMLWHNLGVLYDQHGATQRGDQTRALIGQAAERFEGSLHAYGANVFLEHALAYYRRGRTEPMLTLLRPVHRHRTGADQPPADRASWLEIYSSLLLEAGRHEEALPEIERGIELAQALGQSEREASLLFSRARAALARDDEATALASLERARQLVELPALATTKLAASVWLNLVPLLLRQGAAHRYAEARALCARAVDVLRGLDLAETHDYGVALYHHAVLTEYLGDWIGAARGYFAAARVGGVQKDTATEWLSLAGRAWFEAGEFDAASNCYLDSVRRRVAA